MFCQRFGCFLIATAKKKKCPKAFSSVLRKQEPEYELRRGFVVCSFTKLFLRPRPCENQILDVPLPQSDTCAVRTGSQVVC